MGKNKLFQEQCENVVERLSEEEIKKFKISTNEEERIKIIYNIAKSIQINSVSCGKNYVLAHDYKDKGNKFFASKNYDKAIKYYNEGIIACPQKSDEERELLTILISNRSATYFELKEYNKVFADIDYILSIGNYPKKLEYKIWLRKAKCYDALQNERYSEETYNLAMKSLKHAELSEEVLIKKMEEINLYRKKKNYSQTDSNKAINKIVPISNLDQFTGGNKEFLSAHKSIIFDYTQVLGRFARAVDNIETGVIVIEENPHCAVISQENVLTNCQYCCLTTNQPIACPNCNCVVFCSLNCERQANSSYHKLECEIQPILFESGASINCSMALRIISQKPLSFFQQKKKILKDYLKDNCKKAPIKTTYYKSDDYNTIFFLCRNENIRKKEELIHYACMAIYLTRLLKFADYFGNQIDNLSDDETFIASLILRHLQILQFSSHEISEIRDTNKNEKKDEFKIMQDAYHNQYIGAGIYPTLALFNHSCDPSIIRYNVGNKIVARTIKPIKSGEIIYENYGPIYTSMKVEERKSFLLDRYWFECFCTPCQEDWPIFEQMDDNQLKLACQTDNCPFEFIVRKDDFCPYLQCEWCNNITRIFPYLKGLSELEILLPQAENLYHSGNYRESMKTFMTCLDILFKYSKPPCKDMVIAQQRLRTLLIHLGNKKYNYKQNL